mgnify:CR=1 FL=1
MKNKKRDDLKLVADFYCNKYVNYTWGGESYKWQCDISNCEYDDVWYQEKDLEFDTSWDWLMPVIEKCKIIIDGKGVVNLIHYHEIMFSLNFFDTKKTYKLVVEFINYYNKNK